MAGVPLAGVFVADGDLAEVFGCVRLDGVSLAGVALSGITLVDLRVREAGFFGEIVLMLLGGTFFLFDLGDELDEADGDDVAGLVVSVSTASSRSLRFALALWLGVRT